ncbi:hypothetical protein CHS0354_030225 [Potamilus streckersoni]|uniref:USP domain-containing protein n=1 Tax=Potamilus streckersoni TaxID=2493646 RepID=A0AAE0VIF3_9BIVA|nr:hypothetical protein CHS0354_030225 [Potamilus streckersoni]
MVIAEADSDAVKKRPRLSLKAYRQLEKSPAVGTSKTSVAHAVKSPVKQSVDQKEDQVVLSSNTKEDNEEGRKKEERAKVPNVSSLENLGNTCFLNSILQVLRYTPGFVSSLSRLYHYILLVEKRKKLENAEREESGDILEKETSGSEVWEVVKNLFRLYRNMNRKELNYEEIASDDVMSMALRPNKVLRSISELNSMFEGNLQHDAQELLRCLLCYLQEAEGEVSKYQDHIKLVDKTTDGKPVNPIMQRFLNGCLKAGGSGENAESAKDSSDCCKNVPGDGPTIDSVKINLFPKTDILDQIDKMEVIKLNNPTMPRHGDTASVVDRASVRANVIDQTSASGFPEHLLSSNRSGIADFSTLNSEENAAFPAVLKNLSKQRTIIPKPGRAVASRGRGRPRTRNISTKNTDAEMPVKMINTSEVAANNQDDMNGSELVNPEVIQKKQSLLRSQTHFQPSIISMFEHSMTGRGRRLGLRGAVRKQESVSLMETEDQSNLVETGNNNQNSVKRNQFHSKRRNCDMADHDNSQACNEAETRDQDVISMKRTKLENPSSTRAETCTIQAEKKALYKDLEVEEEEVDLIPEGDFSPCKEQNGQCIKENNFPLSSALKYATDSCKEVMSCIRSSPRKLLSAISSLSGSIDGETKSSIDTRKSQSPPPKLLKEARSPKKSEQIITENFEEKNLLSEKKSPTGAISPSKRASSPRKSANTPKQPQELTNKMSATSPDRAKLRSPDKRENSPVSQQTSKTSITSVDSCIQSPSICCSHRNQETSSKTLQKMSESRNLEQSSHTPQKLLQPYIKLEKIDYLYSNVVKTKTKHVAENQILRRSVRNSNSPFKRHVNGKLVCKREITEMTSDEELDDLEDIFSMKPACISPGSQANSPGMKCLCIPTPQKLHKDFVERLFQGTMKLETRCLECEAATEKREEFHDISVPVKLEELDSDTEDQTDGSPPSPCMTQLIKASIKVEKLAGDNKYYCESCLHKVEAERSIQYEILPDILTLHLKRFSAGSGIGYISKINDHINIPMSLPCIKSRCSTSCRRVDHRYILYGIVTHAGFSLGSGHYLAYVRALPTEATKDESITSMFLSQIKNETKGVNESLAEDTGHATRCKTGTHIKLPSRFENSVSLDRKIRPLAGSVMKEENFKDNKKNMTASNKWYEVDDETVRIFQEDEFQDLLMGKTGSLIGTPYLLFYHKGNI